MVNPGFWQWAGYALMGAITLFFIPGRYRGYLIFALLLGGLVYLKRQGTSLQAIIHTVETGGRE